MENKQMRILFHRPADSVAAHVMSRRRQRPVDTIKKPASDWGGLFLFIGLSLRSSEADYASVGTGAEPTTT
jgi:hypothetical protein